MDLIINACFEQFSKSLWIYKGFSRLITKIKIKEIDEAPTLVSSHSQGNLVVSHGIQLSSAGVA